MIAPTTKSGSRILSWMLILISMAQAMDQGKRTWTLVAQKEGYAALGRHKGTNLSTITISYNATGENQFRLVSMIKGANKRFYFGTDKHRDLEGQQRSVLTLTEEDIDRVNNCVLLRIRASAKLGRVCNRRIFYLEQDGPAFMRFLHEEGRIQGLIPEEYFIRHTVETEEGDRVTGYVVTLNKDDWTNNMASNFVSNWAMQQTSQLRVYMNGNKVKHFELAESTGCVRFNIAKISTYDEEYNRVLLTLVGTKDVLHQNWRNFKGVKNRWLHLDSNTDSKKFLLFLMEMYHSQLKTEGELEIAQRRREEGDDSEEPVFTRAAEACIPTIFQDSKEAGLVREHIAERENTLKAQKLYDICGGRQENEIRRRRLVEAAYQSFIGFNVLLMCCLLVGISFAYHIGTQEENYEAIRW